MPSRRARHAAGLVRTRFPIVATSVFCQEADCPRLRRLRTQSYNFAQFVCTSQQTQHILSPPTSAHDEKFVTVHQNVSLQAFMEEGSTEKPRLGKILPPPKPEHCVLPNVGQHPKNRTSSFAISPRTPGCFALGSSSGNRT